MQRSHSLLLPEQAVVRPGSGGLRGHLARGAIKVLAAAYTWSSLVASIEAHATEISWAPRLRQLTRATDNLLTSSTNPEAALGFDIGASVELAAANPTWRSVLIPRVNIRRFAIGKNVDAEEFSIKSSHQWAISSALSTTLVADFMRDSTLTTELTDTGRDNAAVDRDTVVVQPGIQYALSQQTSFNVGFFYTDVNFDVGQATSFAPYDDKQVSAGVSHAYSPILTFYANSYLSEFRTPGNSGQSITLGGRAGLIYLVDETFQGDLSIGHSRSWISFESQVFDRFAFVVDPATGQLTLQPIFLSVDNSVDADGTIAGATLTKSFENMEVSIAYDRAISPSSFGSQTLTDDIELTMEYRFSRRFWARFVGAYNMRSIESDLATNGRVSLNRNQALVSGTLSYRIDNEWSLSATYRLFRNDFSDTNQTVYNNGVFISISFVGAPHFF